MTTTFDSVLLPNASKLKAETVISIRDATLLSGKHYVQSNTNTAFNPIYRCMGSLAEYEALEAKVGTSGSLVTPSKPSGYSGCYIATMSEMEESDNPSYFYWTMSFKRHTAS